MRYVRTPKPSGPPSSAAVPDARSASAGTARTQRTITPPDLADTHAAGCITVNNDRPSGLKRLRPQQNTGLDQDKNSPTQSACKRPRKAQISESQDRPVVLDQDGDDPSTTPAAAGDSSSHHSSRFDPAGYTLWVELESRRSPHSSLPKPSVAVTEHDQGQGTKTNVPQILSTQTGPPPTAHTPTSRNSSKSRKSPDAMATAPTSGDSPRCRTLPPYHPSPPPGRGFAIKGCASPAPESLVPAIDFVQGLRAKVAKQEEEIIERDRRIDELQRALTQKEGREEKYHVCTRLRDKAVQKSDNLQRELGELTKKLDDREKRVGVLELDAELDRDRAMRLQQESQAEQQRLKKSLHDAVAERDQMIYDGREKHAQELAQQLAVQAQLRQQQIAWRETDIVALKKDLSVKEARIRELAHASQTATSSQNQANQDVAMWKDQAQLLADNFQKEKMAKDRELGHLRAEMERLKKNCKAEMAQASAEAAKLRQQLDSQLDAIMTADTSHKTVMDAKTAEMTMLNAKIKVLEEQAVEIEQVKTMLATMLPKDPAHPIHSQGVMVQAGMLKRRLDTALARALSLDRDKDNLAVSKTTLASANKDLAEKLKKSEQSLQTLAATAKDQPAAEHSVKQLTAERDQVANKYKTEREYARNLEWEIKQLKATADQESLDKTSLGLRLDKLEKQKAALEAKVRRRDAECDDLVADYNRLLPVMDRLQVERWWFARLRCRLVTSTGRDAWETVLGPIPRLRGLPRDGVAMDDGLAGVGDGHGAGAGEAVADRADATDTVHQTAARAAS